MKKEAFLNFQLNCIVAFLVAFLLLPFGAKAQTEIGYKKKGTASFYAHKFQGLRTTNGERYHNKKMTAAHRTLPFGTLVKVTNLRNDRSVIVRINDRGPFSRGRLIDVSHIAATELGIVAAGTAPVEIEVIGTDAISPEFDTETLAKVADPVTPKNISLASAAQKPQSWLLPEPVAINQYEIGKIYTIKGVSTSTRGFGVQIGSFLQVENAMSFCNGLTDKKIHQVYILVEKIKDNKKFCVVAGTFEKRKEAEAFVASLKEQGFSDGFVKKYAN